MVAGAVALGLIAPMWGTEAAEAEPTEVTIPVSDAAWTTTRAPDTPQGRDILSVTATADRTFLKFAGADLQGRTIESATLLLAVRSTTATEPGVVVRSSTNAWSSSTLTQSNQPAQPTATISRPSSTAEAGGTLSIPIDKGSISTKGDFSFQLSYLEPYIRLALEGTGPDAPRLVVELASTPTSTVAPAPTTDTDGGGDGEPMVFAHYFVPYPLSIDNQPTASDYYARNYLRPDGEDGKFASVGGLLRDRPLATAVSASSAWRVANFVTEIRAAKSAGIDGWTLNLMSTAGNNWEAAQDVMTAADQVGGFVVVPMVDASSSFGDATPATVASRLSELYAHKSAYKPSGEYLLSSFKAEGNSTSWWSQVISALESQHRRPITFQAVFNNASDANMRAFASIADGYGNWGTRTERTTLNSPNNDARAASFGKTWMAPVAVQDVRYKSSSWAEANNTESVRAQWEKAIDEKADYVQIVTWNDYSESTQIAPSQDHGSAFLDLTRYYTSWFHSGIPPRITTDEIVLTHRTQFVNAVPTYSHTLMGAPALDGSATSPRDSVEALVWLPSAATVQITVGTKTSTYSAPAGMSAYTAPLGLGTVSAKIVRNGTTSESLTSPHTVVSRPYVQDLQYHAASSW